MNTKNEPFVKVADESGEDFYCPLDGLAESGHKVEPDACVEAVTVERYSGNLNILD